MKSSMRLLVMEGCIKITATFKEKILQGWNFIGPGGIYFPRNDILKWLTWANDGATVNFQVPQISNCNVIALTVCFTLLDNGVDQGRLFPDTLGLWVTNHTKRTSFFNHSENYFEESSRLCEYLWLGHISHNKFNSEGGDLVEVFVRVQSEYVKVEKTGVSLVWDTKQADFRVATHREDWIFYSCKFAC
ncbi:hypothetical protein RchiOBHm_Chr7g0208211 [Rosa chinensis]|uniref:Uncharacterized protein n=1 Tax=Rosa chinensis TaxID=74649 RepID=A0A2P6P9M8_ROSCH|nr:uncharacterized protein LOC112178850 [Rosa chinensis]PRQ18633.1 hypothetical protein RchiOBHm_Chr7g0208211 [Rosa chinensis]